MRQWYDTLFKDPRATAAAALHALLNPKLREPFLGTPEKPWKIAVGRDTATVDPMAAFGMTSELGGNIWKSADEFATWMRKMNADAPHPGLAPTTMDQMQLLEEGKPTTLPAIPTREELGTDMLMKTDMRVPVEPSVPQQTAEQLAKRFPSLPAGSAVAWQGERWVNTTKGWTKLGNRPLKSDYDWILRSSFDIETPITGPGGMALPNALDSNPERAVELLQEHGKMTSDRARRVVGDHIRARIKSGKALSQDVVWWNLHKMGELGGGGKISWF